MKNILILLTILLTLSCKDDGVSYSCTKGTIRVLDKEKLGEFYKMYLYDGAQAYWCYTNYSTYNSYQINDTLQTLVITKTYEKRN